MTYVIKADTPEECRLAIVDWLHKESTQHNAQSRIARLKSTQKEYQALAAEALAAANFISNIKIEPKS